MGEYENAEKDYMAGMKYKDIAEKYEVSINTVKSWKKRYGWERKKGAHKNEKGCTQKMGVQHLETQPAAGMEYDGTRETLQNDDLTAEQQLFCIYYSRTFNATQSYLKAYRCDYVTANVCGPRLLVNVSIKKEIERLKEIKRQQIVADEADMVELQMRIAFADMGDYLSFGMEKVPVMSMYGPVQVKNKETGEKEILMQDMDVVRLNESSRVDTQLIQEVKQGKSGVSVKLADKQKAMDWLTKYFLMHPTDKNRAEFEKRRAENEAKRAEERDNNIDNILKNMETIAEVLSTPVVNRNIEDFEEMQADEQTGTI